MKLNKSWQKKFQLDEIILPSLFSYRKYRERKTGKRQKWEIAVVLGRCAVLEWSLQTNHDYSKQTVAYQQLFK